jgi:hypothetical protein
MKVKLAEGNEVFIRIRKGEKEVDAYHKGKLIKVKKRITTIKITNEGNLDLEATVSCSHKDNFSKLAGRREALKTIFAQDTTKKLSREDRSILAKALHIGGKDDGD